VKLKKPHFWDYTKPNIISILLLPLTIPIFLKNFFTLASTEKFEKIKTICVGNIYLGGTGKTPFTIKLNEIIKKLNFKSGIIKKYYKDQIDEQKILRINNKLYCENDRSLAIQKAINDKRDIIVFDDGLQEKAINYNLSFVCFNIQNWIGNGLLLPAGPLREKLSSLKNYSAVVLNGNGENTNHIRKQIKKYNSKIKIFETKYVPTNLKKFKKNTKYLIFSGIGNPNTFNKTLLVNKIKIADTVIFPDHYQYTTEDVIKIRKLAKKHKAKILTTEKDYLRLNNKNKKKIEYLKVKLVIKNERKLISFLKSSL
tara:strand:+ start:482 stop:1417 length:936 start_codon:yes stop_codon:yes gene_type:complete